MEPQPESINQRIRRLREARGMSAAELNKACGFESTRVYKYETGVNTPDTASLTKLARALGVTTDELLCGDEPAREASA